MLESCDCNGPSGPVPDYNEIKKSLANMPDDRKAVLALIAGFPGFTIRWHDGITHRTSVWRPG